MQFQLIGMETATPAELARTEDPGLSIAREAAEVVPAESVRRNGGQYFFCHINFSLIKKVAYLWKNPLFLMKMQPYSQF